MGFTTGLTGGVTLTLGVAYLTVLAHQRNREHQAAILRQQTLLLSGVYDPLPPVLPPTRAELAVASRANLIESAKDRWNAEVENAVRWAQTTDWDEVREGVERAVGRLWAKALGDAQEELAKAEKGTSDSRVAAAAVRVKEEARKGEVAAREKTESVTVAAKNAYADSKAKTVEAARNAYSDAKATTADAASKTGEKAGEARGSVLDAISRGLEKAKSAVGIVEEKVGDKVDEVLSSSAASPVEKALSQRYQPPSAGKARNVDEALAARYVPVEQRDNTQLRAL